MVLTNVKLNGINVTFCSNNGIRFILCGNKSLIDVFTVNTLIFMFPDDEIDLLAIITAWLKRVDRSATTPVLARDGNDLVSVPRQGNRRGGAGILCRDIYSCKSLLLFLSLHPSMVF